VGGGVTDGLLPPLSTLQANPGDLPTTLLIDVAPSYGEK